MKSAVFASWPSNTGTIQGSQQGKSLAPDRLPRTRAEPSPSSRRTPDRPSPPERRDFAGRVERAVRVAIEPVGIEAQGPERNEGRRDRWRRGVQPPLCFRELTARQAPQFRARPRRRRGRARNAIASKRSRASLSAAFNGFGIGAVPRPPATSISAKARPVTRCRQRRTRLSFPSLA
jgi:hypothetical protein